ncbi:hypothetical protein PYW07_010664 [Mythimna separata]|uniref:EGF-like domain-containing protein n=1 Tax=Mythimna separata TaxID=271217 RepID=A0AAD8DL07_MYTSE|nr:hypothetical protein PYW07_010664 [Mythimna separata]
MCITRVLALLAMLVGLAESFPWDVVVGGKEKTLEFYNNGILTHTEDITSANDISAIAYDPVHYRLLVFDYNSANYNRQKSTVTIFSFDLSTRNIRTILTKKANGYLISRTIYDPVTELLFWIDGCSIYSYSLDYMSFNQVTDGNVFVTLDHDCPCYDIAVDSCGGYIYWITETKIERARLDGSEREVLLSNPVYRTSLAIDQQTQKIYWSETKYYNSMFQVSIESADFNGKNNRTIYTEGNKTQINAVALSISKFFLYMITTDLKDWRIWKLQKKPTEHLERKMHLISDSYCSGCHRMAVNYTLKDQIQGIKSCKGVQYLVPGYSEPECTVEICQNYCLHGNCSVNAEGLPNCSCKAGYSGERCEVNACTKHCLNGGVCSLNEEELTVCQCTADYDGQRCDVPICKDYCLQGNCSVGTEGLPNCSCEVGYSGERCEVNACHKHCLNNGVCSLNEEDEPACECTADYEGERCDVAITQTDDDHTTQQILEDLRGEVKHLQYILQLLSDKIDEYETKI